MPFARGIFLINSHTESECPKAAVETCKYGVRESGHPVSGAARDNLVYRDGNRFLWLPSLNRKYEGNRPGEQGIRISVYCGVDAVDFATPGPETDFVGVRRPDLSRLLSMLSRGLQIANVYGMRNTCAVWIHRSENFDTASPIVLLDCNLVYTGMLPRYEGATGTGSMSSSNSNSLISMALRISANAKQY